VRDYDLKLPKKVKALARASALSVKFNEGLVKVIEDFTFETPKTKQYLEILGNLSLQNQKTLLVTSDYDKSVYLSARNIPKAEVAAVKDLNTYQVMNAGTLLFNESAVNKIG
jgi:large subunit ribosomal protein L4